MLHRGNLPKEKKEGDGEAKGNQQSSRNAHSQKYAT